jgi:outer membrane protein TolC
MTSPVRERIENEIPFDTQKKSTQLVAFERQVDNSSDSQTRHTLPNSPVVAEAPELSKAAPFVADTAESSMSSLSTDTSTTTVRNLSAHFVGETIPLNLPSVLAAIDGQHPVVGQAQWSVKAAYAELDRAKALWLPSIQAGFSFHRHDGNYQASDGSIIDVNRNSFQYGLGAGATGAGTTAQRPGVFANFHLADAIFLPKVARKNAWAEDHAANAVRNRQLLRAGRAYFALLESYQEQRILEQSCQRFSELAQVTLDFAEAGEGLKADADRLQTESRLAEARLIGIQEKVFIASAQLAEAISLDSFSTIIPLDENAIPLELVQSDVQPNALVSTALQARPELRESQALVAAACEAYRREKMAPFVPSVVLGFSSGGFGGGLGNQLDDVEGRYDLDALLAWELRNMGLGEHAAKRGRAARVQQAQFAKLAVMDQVASEVKQAIAKVESRRRQVDVTRSTISAAQNSYFLNLDRIRDRQGLPLEVLQSVHALEQAQREYLRAVTRYNQAQIELQWALGFPVRC